jgi:hypothetical protein
MHEHGVSFSIVSQAAWAPGIDTPEAWAEWAKEPYAFSSNVEPAVVQMPAMLRRRAGFLGKMALEVAYRCLEGRSGVPTVFCSRHGDVARAVGLITDLVQDSALSPTSFGLAVHNASAGLFSIARADQSNHLALSAGTSTVEYGVIEACSLLADGAPMVMLVVYDDFLPAVFAEFKDCLEQPHAWAWLMVPASASEDVMHLSWSACHEVKVTNPDSLPASLEILRFQFSDEKILQRVTDQHRWCWKRRV